MIETGRLDGILKDERKCTFCDEIDDEVEALFYLTAYNLAWEGFLDATSNLTITGCSENDVFIHTQNVNE